MQRLRDLNGEPSLRETKNFKKKIPNFLRRISNLNDTPDLQYIPTSLITKPPHPDPPSRGDHQIQPQQNNGHQLSPPPRFAASPQACAQMTKPRTHEPREKHDERNNDPTREKHSRVRASWLTLRCCSLFGTGKREEKMRTGCVALARGLGAAGAPPFIAALAPGADPGRKVGPRRAGAGAGAGVPGLRCWRVGRACT
jgi:hypothetical protein